MGTQRTLGRLGSAAVALAIVLGATVAVQGASSARPMPRVTLGTCLAKPWTQRRRTRRPRRRRRSRPSSCRASSCGSPRRYRHDEVGIVALNAYSWFQNVNEFGLTSTVQRQLASLGMPPITLEDGPGGLITRTTPETDPAAQRARARCHVRPRDGRDVRDGARRPGPPDGLRRRPGAGPQPRARARAGAGRWSRSASRRSSPASWVRPRPSRSPHAARSRSSSTSGRTPRRPIGACSTRS